MQIILLYAAYRERLNAYEPTYAMKLMDHKVAHVQLAEHQLRLPALFLIVRRPSVFGSVKLVFRDYRKGKLRVLEAVVQLLLYYQHLPRHNVPVQLFLYRYYVV